MITLFPPILPRQMWCAGQSVVLSCSSNAASLVSRCHLPILYVGLEYSLTNNLRLAERLYSESLKFYPDDPAVLHELGVINYLNRE